MRDRLIRLLCGVKCEGEDRREGGCPRRVDDECTNINKLEMCMIETIADYLLENGVIVPPCKVGDTVYYFYESGDKVYEGEVTSFVYVSGTKSFSIHCDGVFGRYGRYVFLTREEAEQALKGEHHAEIH